MAYDGDRRALAARTVRGLVRHVLAEERHPPITCHVTFLSPARMRRLNRQTFGLDRSTDVIAFGLPHGDALVGDVYVCPSAARAAARTHRITPREELIRLVTHGLLHVLGHDHPAGPERVDSPMWRRQEAYVASWLERRS